MWGYRWVQVGKCGVKVGEGNGKSKKIAEQHSAEMALKKLAMKSMKF